MNSFSFSFLVLTSISIVRYYSVFLKSIALISINSNYSISLIKQLIFYTLFTIISLILFIVFTFDVSILLSIITGLIVGIITCIVRLLPILFMLKNKK